MSEPLIAARGVGVTVGKRVLVHDIDLEVGAGEIVTVIGPNGAGKTTLVRTLLGVLRNTEGRIIRKPHLRVGYVPQKIALNATMPVTVSRLMTAIRPATESDMTAALERTGVAHLARQSVHTLSGGEFRRVLLARALLCKPDLLVLDEPVQGVDYTGETALYELISQIRDELGCGVLMVSHDLHVVMAATDRVICLNHHVCCTGRPREVSQHAEYRRLFGPRAAENLALYEHHHDHDHDLAGEVADDDHEHDHRHAHGGHPHA